MRDPDKYTWDPNREQPGEPSIVSKVLRELFAAVGLMWFLVSLVAYAATGHWWPFT